jgi:ElaB/YqjD/DUF883 family membrane-anchored ribosome-binding protein
VSRKRSSGTGIPMYVLKLWFLQMSVFPGWNFSLLRSLFPRVRSKCGFPERLFARATEYEPLSITDGDYKMAGKPGRLAEFQSDAQGKIRRAVHDVKDSAAAHMPDTEHLLQQLEDAKATIRDLSARVTQTARDAGDSASHAFTSASDSIGQVASDVSHKASATAQTAVHNAEAVGSEIESFTRRNPIVALAAALTFGLVLGMSTRGRK